MRIVLPLKSQTFQSLPAAFVVEEKDEVELLLGLVLHLLSNAEHVQWRDWYGHPVVIAAHPRHVRVDYL